MSQSYGTVGELELDDDFIEDYDETQGVSKKNWFGPASASLARLDKVKPMATVYNIGLRDPRDLKTGRGRASPVVTNDQLTDLPTEPPLSTVSYQKAAWGSETPVPELLKQAAQAGTRPSRPSSAKSGAVSRPPVARKSRPQSAKDPLCPDGKKKASTLGVKGQKFDPSERYGRNVLPPNGVSLGWAGPPAGLCDPTLDGTINSVKAANSEKSRSQAPPPPAPNCSPEPQDVDVPFGESQHYSPPSSPGLHLSLSLPNADDDVTDEPDTGRLLAEADKYVKTQKKKESQKIKFFKADSHGPGGIGEALKTTLGASKERSSATSGSSGPADARKSSVTTEILQEQTDQTEEETEKVENENSAPDDTPVENGATSGDSILNESDEMTVPSLDIKTSENGSQEDELSVKPLPPSNGFDLEYLGPAKQDRKSRSHPIFLMPDDKPSSQKQPGKQAHGHRPSSGKDRAVNDKDTAETKSPRIPKGTKKEEGHPTVGGKDHGNSGTSTLISRTGVHIREDRNITVDITPRNLGRKVTGKSRKHREQNDVPDLEIKNDLSAYRKTSLTEDNTPNLEITATSAKARTQSPTGIRPSTPVSTISVFYDDDDDSSETSSIQKKKRRRQGPVKEKDLVTMVSNINLSDDDDDASAEVEIEMGDAESDDQREHRCASVLSTEEKNYYNIARKQKRSDNNTAASLEEKENFITMTTKTIFFDSDKPKESIVKTILDAPLSRPRDRRTPVSPPKHLARPKSVSQHRPQKLSQSDFQSVTPASPPVPSKQGGGDVSDGGFTSSAVMSMPPDEERPGSRLGFVPMETDPRFRDEGDGDGTSEKKQTSQQHGFSHRPPSGKRRPLSASSNTLNKLPAKQSLQRAKDTVVVNQRPRSASSVPSRSPSVADVQRANAAAQALHTEMEIINKPSPSAVHIKESRRQYASYNRTTTTQRSSRTRSALLYRKPVQLNSKYTCEEEEDSEAMEECKKIQNRLACYGIDIQAQTLERALFPPTGRTLYYEIDAQLPKSYSTGLLSHPRYWLPVEHKRLKLAEKKLALAELSLWQQKKEEERKARLAAGKEKGPKKGKKKGKKKLRRSQSIC